MKYRNETPKIELNLTNIGFLVSLFYLAKHYEDWYAITVFWWWMFGTIILCLVGILAISGGENVITSYIHPVTSAVSLLVSIVTVWMIFSLGFTYLGIGYAVVSLILFIFSIPYVRA